jgi:soluble lytic murein transglycosylase-like protein
MGQRFGIPPLVLYGVALQESAKLFGEFSLPWPWTLNVQGTPRRYARYAEAVEGLRAIVASGIRNVDTGLMQVNWGYHRDRLIEPSRALDPYPNIAVGATILRSHFERTRNWYAAVGRYHSPGNAERAANYSALVFRRIAQVPQSAALTGASRV